MEAGRGRHDTGANRTSEEECRPGRGVGGRFGRIWIGPTHWVRHNGRVRAAPNPTHICVGFGGAGQFGQMRSERVLVGDLFCVFRHIKTV